MLRKLYNNLKIGNNLSSIEKPLIEKPLSSNEKPLIENVLKCGIGESALGALKTGLKKLGEPVMLMVGGSTMGSYWASVKNTKLERLILDKKVFEEYKVDTSIYHEDLKNTLANAVKEEINNNDTVMKSPGEIDILNKIKEKLTNLTDYVLEYITISDWLIINILATLLGMKFTYWYDEQIPEWRKRIENKIIINKELLEKDKENYKIKLKIKILNWFSNWLLGQLKTHKIIKILWIGLLIFNIHIYLTYHFAFIR